MSTCLLQSSAGDKVFTQLPDEDIDTIMHFAAETHVDNSFGNSFSFTSNNVVGTQVLLEASRGTQIRRFLHVSTDEVYGENTAETEEGFNETIANPYGEFFYKKNVTPGEHIVFKIIV